MSTPLLPLEPIEGGIPTTPESYWDQFDENKRLFGTKSTYDPSMSAYTTPLVVDSLTEEQIARAEKLSRIPLPSEKFSSTSSELTCVFCEKGFKDTSSILGHIRELILVVLLGSATDNEDDNCATGVSQVKSLLKRKSWIMLQESLPVGLVSQIESLYKRQVTSSTNLQMILEAVRTGEGVSEDTREYLMNELVSLVAVLLNETRSRDHAEKKPVRQEGLKIKRVATMQ
jgi:hypothetical protein